MKRWERDGEMQTSHTDIREHLKSILIIVLLVMVTLAALEIPHGFYNHSDEQLLNQVIESTYSVNVVKEPMDLSQKIEALKDDDSIVAEKKDRATSEEKKQWIERMRDEIDVLLDYAWHDMLEFILADEDTESYLNYMEILQVSDDKIYSYDLGVFNFYNSEKYSMMEPGLILFDVETGKILYLEVMIDYPMAGIGYTDPIYSTDLFVVTEENGVYAGSYDVDIQESDTAIADANEAERQDREVALSYYAELKAYYNVELDSEDYPFVSEYAVCACPFTIDDISGKTMTTIYDYAYKFYSKLY
ncbi:MAG: hypothetical protein ACI39Q_08450 [Wujia sp.]